MYHQLTEPERYTLSVLKREGRSLRDIALSLQRSPSTISREIKRNATIDHNRPRPLYVPSKAQEHANGRRRRSRRIKHHAPEIYEVIEDLLKSEQWSPEQIADHFARDPGRCISHMTIYRHVRKDQRQGGGLFRHLRQGGKKRRKRTPGLESAAVCRANP